MVVLGWLVTVVDVGQFWPQFWRAVRRRSAMHGLSPWTWGVVTVQGALWVSYGLLDGLWAIWLPNLVITPMAAVVTVVALLSRRDLSLQTTA